MGKTGDINVVQETYESGVIEYDPTDLPFALSLVGEIRVLLGEAIKNNLDQMKDSEASWNGEAKKQYEELKRFYELFLEDFSAAVEEYEDAIQILESLIKPEIISTANVLVEV